VLDEAHLFAGGGAPLGPLRKSRRFP
jgi:hypothetical protein